MRPQRFIYVVAGETGEYEDAVTWNARAFESKDAADRWVREMESRLREYGFLRDTRDYNSRRCNPDKWEPLLELDPRFKSDGDGVDYAVAKVPFEGGDR